MTPAPNSPRPLIIPVLLSGGTGTRLWPLSREAYPKQFLPMHGEHTLLQQAALRTASQARFGRTMVIVNHDHRFIVAEQLRALDLAATIVVEPSWPQHRACGCSCGAPRARDGPRRPSLADARRSRHRAS